MIKMNRTWKDKAIAKIKQKMNMHKYLKPLMMVWLVCVVVFYNIATYFMRNTKRFACVLTVFIIFIASSSFSFLSVQERIGVISESEQWAEIQENYEYAPTTFHIPAEEVLDDNDVLEGYDNKELDVAVSDLDQYSLDDFLAANEATKNVDKAADSPLTSLSPDDWQLVLVNKQHPVPDDYTFTLGTIKGKMKCDVRIIDDLTEMMKAARADGINLMVCSPYRDYNRQTVLFNRKIDSYMEKGHSYLEAYKLASMTVTVPGASEHQIGLALDIISSSYYSLDEGFGETKAGLWLKEHCDEYGFILRYPLGKEYITGIQYEPWHFRYVGKVAAQNIMERDITLEEFLEDLEKKNR